MNSIFIIVIFNFYCQEFSILAGDEKNTRTILRLFQDINMLPILIADWVIFLAAAEEREKEEREEAVRDILVVLDLIFLYKIGIIQRK